MATLIKILDKTKLQGRAIFSSNNTVKETAFWSGFSIMPEWAPTPSFIVDGEGLITTSEGDALIITPRSAITFFASTSNTWAGGSINASNCTNLSILWCYNNALTSLNVSGCASLAELSCQDNLLTSLNVSGLTSLSALNCQNNQLTEASVNSILIALDVLGRTNGTIDVLGTNASPTGAGLTAKDNLESKGWTVITN